ncbi:asparaginase [Salinimonas lutimaris]|uniref:asparaginase n=1 Tax=Salinimonas lutimaris TaxID=914153 RepID=UPI0010BF9668|nr:asparaginase [Salinimonas lutimaris]
MKNSALLATLLLFFCFFCGAAERPQVTIYAMGGTIAGAASSNLDSTGYVSGSLGVQTLIDAVPELKSFADVSGRQVANLESSDVDRTLLLKLAKTIHADLAKPDTSGVVVTHGTDTLEETAFFLDLTTRSPKPVVIVGAMRPATAISADGAMNLYDAVKLAASDSARHRGAMVVMNDRISPAMFVTKTDTHAVEAFQSPEAGYLGGFINGQPYFYYAPTQPVNKPHFDISEVESLPDVSILYSYQDQDDTLIRAAIKNGAKGIVIAGTGNGSIPGRIKPAVKEAMARGIPVVIASRIDAGYVTANDEAIGSGFYNPQKAKIILSLALARHDSMETIRGYFATL